VHGHGEDQAGVRPSSFGQHGAGTALAVIASPFSSQ
jgi:hypothetical protein